MQALLEKISKPAKVAGTYEPPKSSNALKSLWVHIDKRVEQKRKSEAKEELFWSMWERPIVYDALGRGWADTVPKWIKDEIILQRLIQVMKGEGGKATDAEVAVYLYTANLARPISHEYTRIYCNLVCKLMEQRGKNIGDIRKEVGADRPLTEYELGELDSLKRKIWNAGIRASESKRRARKKQLKELDIKSKKE